MCLVIPVETINPRLEAPQTSTDLGDLDAGVDDRMNDILIFRIIHKCHYAPLKA